MPPTIKKIPLSLPMNLGTVNCYLIGTGDGWILIDAGPSQQRKALEEALTAAGCVPGSLKLLLITHGDFDHTGSAAYVRGKYDAKIAMHTADTGMLERGDMFANRKKGNGLIRAIAPWMFGFGKAQRCTPDILVEDGFNLEAFGLDARVVTIPGHSLGSIGVLTAQGDFFCGDLLDNTQKPALNSIMDDPESGSASVKKLQDLPIQTIYPGHGDPFPAPAFFAAS